MAWRMAAAYGGGSISMQYRHDMSRQAWRESNIKQQRSAAKATA